VRSGRKLSDADRRARDRLILEVRSQGLSWPQIAQTFSLSETAARSAAANAARLAAEAGLEGIDAGALVEQIVRTEARALYRLDELLHDPNASVAVGAARAIGLVGRDLRQSLIAAGLLPGEGDVLKQARERQVVVDALLRAAQAAGIPLDRVEEELTARGSRRREHPR